MYDEKRRIAELKSYLESLPETLGRRAKNALRAVNIRALKVFYGKKIYGQSMHHLFASDPGMAISSPGEIKSENT